MESGNAVHTNRKQTTNLKKCTWYMNLQCDTRDTDRERTGDVHRVRVLQTLSRDGLPLRQRRENGEKPKNNTTSLQYVCPVCVVVYIYIYIYR